MKPSVIDLRSDTVTQPSAAMKQAMCEAPLGDDVYGEDPTVNRLQEEMAALFGKEAGLFVPTGVMSNQLAIKAWTSPGDEVIVERESHIFNYETAAPSMMSAVQLNPVAGAGGVLAAEDVEATVRPDAYYYPRTTLVCIENTHNRMGGTLFPIEAMRSLQDFCRMRAIGLHLDGARIWNAHIASGTPLVDFGSAVDSISICFSKGLGAPVGSMLLGSRDLITRAHKYRKIYGGGMRQAGMLAAAALHAVEHHLPLLVDDHRRARTFAAALTQCSAFHVDITRVQSNMVLLDFSNATMRAAEAQKRLRDAGIEIGMGMGDMLRAVFHLDLDDSCLTQSIDIFTRLFD
ncbi:MAG: aminotransferase class I/II-fold pyridoxal phosphate-dependent enzyme [Bacteroidetes bacterium]|nr:aminotransferase class I/II-fold pyridoxal phosphate-dependent enzyme [Bacteroidota bacterium]